MEDAICIKTKIKEETIAEYTPDCKFEGLCKKTIDVTHTPDYMESEEIVIKYEPLETVSCSVVKDERQHHAQTKKDSQDEYFSGYENEDFQIATERDEMNSISTGDDIKSEEIDIKYEPLEDIGLSFIENRKTLSVTCTETGDEVTKPDHMLKPKDLNLDDPKTIASRFEIKYKSDAEENVSANLTCLKTEVYECNICHCKKRRKADLRRHMLIHVDPTKTTTYECNNCLYKTRRKTNLRSHMRMHKNPSERKIYECYTCLYKTRWKSTLKTHMLCHKDPSMATYECNSCQYKGWRKVDLQRHMVNHTDPSERETYECNTCQYKTWSKSTLQTHMLVHTDLSKIPMHECSICGFKTRLKKYLSKHVLIHRDPSETKMYECNTCMYKTRQKSNLQRHIMLRHINPKRKRSRKCHN